jgi:hypothetical protein
MFVCLSCLEAYFDDLGKCPKKSCSWGEVVSIDDDLVPIIVELNKKGYATQMCCSGHAYEGSENPRPRTFISFEPFIERKLFPNFPIGFSVTQHQNKLFIEACYESSNGLRAHALVAQGIARLALWVEKLPPIDDHMLVEVIEKQHKADMKAIKKAGQPKIKKPKSPITKKG